MAKIVISMVFLSLFAISVYFYILISFKRSEISVMSLFLSEVHLEMCYSENNFDLWLIFVKIIL